MKVGLVVDLSILASNKIEKEAAALKDIWAANWDQYSRERTSVEAIVAAVDRVREEIKTVLGNLE